MNSGRNIYRNGVDFASLALQSAAFSKHLKSNGQLDFSDPEAVQQLTKSLLKRDFGLDIELPDDRLCPPVPNRLNYILWLQDLLDTTSDEYTDQYDPEREVIGLDMYGLFYIDDENLQYAKSNVAKNNLTSRIKLLKTTAEGPLFPLDEIGIESLDFTMCNPPFYKSNDELVSSAKEKKRPPLSACTGAEVEMVTPGGEVAFVGRMISESFTLRSRIGWYSSMLGKLSSVSAIIDKLKEVGVTNWAVTEFVQGSKTKRWAVGWSWGDSRPSMKKGMLKLSMIQNVARGVSGSIPKHYLPFPSEFIFSLPAPTTMDDIAQRLIRTLRPLSLLHWRWNQARMTGIGFAEDNVWSRASRRKAAAATAGGPSSSRPRTTGSENTTDEEMDVEDAKLGFGISIRNQGLREERETEVLVRWFKGDDIVLFESFCGMLKRKVVGE
ncbi:MAG: hypothetical protein M1819_003427 [Sarea resinae]|nr:MAG: hypothetical protein M1819_003427 [Sarea resinae]